MIRLDTSKLCAENAQSTKNEAQGISVITREILVHGTVTQIKNDNIQSRISSFQNLADNMHTNTAQNQEQNKSCPEMFV